MFLRSLALLLAPAVMLDWVAARQTNVLFIMFDDLRPELSIYGKSHMVTPNFERLANRSVTFENSYCQIAVCNPSRDSLLSGLRPDTLHDYGFQNSYGNNMIIPTRLAKSGYRTAGFGKIRHWDGADPNTWNHNHSDYDWYGYQNAEYSTVFSSSFADPHTKEENFRDYVFTSDAIHAMHQLHKGPNYFMVSVGYKLPHLMVHFPHKYREMYRATQDVWKVNKKELRFPPSAPSVSYRCCALNQFAHLKNEGKDRADKLTTVGSMKNHFDEEAYKENMWGYSASISFLDAQIGRLLDTLDELNLWNNITIVLTSDHGKCSHFRNLLFSSFLIQVCTMEKRVYGTIFDIYCKYY
jgi:iduronate 2-sulfatase